MVSPLLHIWEGLFELIATCPKENPFSHRAFPTLTVYSVRALSYVWDVTEKCFLSQHLLDTTLEPDSRLLSFALLQRYSLWTCLGRVILQLPPK